MKDLYDIWMLSRTHEFLDENLPRAIAATFARRNTPIPVKRPDALTRAYAEDPAKQQQWASFAASIEIEAGSLAALTAELAEFLMPHLQSARSISRS